VTGGAVRVALLGSTGSIGRQTIDVALHHPDRVRIVSLAANRNGALLAEQARVLGVAAVAMADAAAAPASADLPGGCVCSTGAAAVTALAADPSVDVVLNALVGAAGLRASEAALRSGRRLALANKESLVVGGDLLMRLAAPGQLLPVDSEHSAIFQCLWGEPADRMERIWLTASGGPFRGWSRDALEGVTIEQALAHPRWTMGPKITIDSATLMNKGLEAIEAHHLFAAPYDRITVVVHPQSVVHSMVEFTDGSVKAHLGAADMRVPIQYALSHPDRWDAPCAPLDMAALGALEFEPPDTATFRCLQIALDAGRCGGTAPAAMSAANEVAVAAFLSGSVGLLDIDRIVATVVAEHAREAVESFEQLEEVDARARARAGELVREGRASRAT
jgi:1-deoxy-D-xylulose-5-phosphate reductoisomerase